MSAAALKLDVSAYPPGGRHRPHTHEELQISVVLRGAVRECVAGQVECGAALSVVVKDPGVRHADEYSDCGALIARLAIDATALRDLVERADRADAWRWTHNAAVAAPFLRVLARGSRGEQSFATDDDDITELLAALTARAHVAPKGEAPAWLREAIDTIEHAWHPNLRSRDLAAVAGVHPVYLARCVRRWYGVGTGDLLRSARLRQAARAVANGDETVSTVAHGHGFSDEAHLCRDFARATGIAPGRFRRLVLACDAIGRASSAA